MVNFYIFPVIDILNSIAVHAIKGERNDYQPLKSHLFHSSNPVDIIRNLKDNYDIRQFYIADLDAILKQRPNFELLKKILELGNIDILIDPGIKSIDDLEAFSNFKIKYLILGLETIQNIKVIKESFKFFNKDNLIVSIDMYKEEIITKITKFKGETPLRIIKNLEKLGITQIILLDLFKVGQKLGGIPPLYSKIKSNFKGDIFVGGGIKNFNDVLLYYRHNFSGVLIGTAIYDGSIDLKEINNFTGLINKNNS